MDLMSEWSTCLDCLISNKIGAESRILSAWLKSPTINWKLINLNDKIIKMAWIRLDNIADTLNL